MERFIKNNLKVFITMIITTIIVGSVSVYAASQYFAKDISFTPSDTNKENGFTATNVENALNQLYEKNSSTYDKLTNAKIKEIAGAKIGKDENNDLYFLFDGINDYIELETLPASINWTDGITLEYEVIYNAFNHWSRILDVSNGARSDNIIIANYSTTHNPIYHMFNGSTENTYIPSIINLNANQKYKIKIEYIKNSSNYTINFYLDDQLKETKTTNYTVRNVERKICYIGKSAFPNDGYFNGKIYYLKVDQANGENIIDINANKIFK